jgi:mannose-1-phosphate guanylyltransferase
MADTQTIIPVILSGGSGTRLWPMSTPDRPKQFLPLTGERTMFQLTALRTHVADRFDAPIIVANARHAELIEAQLGEIGVSPAAIILEPCARNTAPAIALAALEAGSAPLLVMPSDHIITNEAAFMAAVAAALPLVEQGWLVTFGITPTGPETGYGYIRKGDALAGEPCKVERFIEKPSRSAAEAMLADGNHLWNGGIFLFRADIYLGALSIHAPDMLAAAKAALAQAKRNGARIFPNNEAFAASPADSIDYAVMEKAERVAVVPVSMGWSDVGSWDALHEIGHKDEHGNLSTENARLDNTSGMMVKSDGIRISASGVDNLIIIASGNEVLILPRGSSQDVKKFAG